MQRWALVVLWMGLIFWLSSVPQLESDLPAMWDFVLRKFAHATEFGILALLWLSALSPKLSRVSRYGAAASFAVLYAVSDEFHQSVVVGRDGKPVDVLIDTFGVLIALGASYNESRPKKCSMLLRACWRWLRGVARLSSRMFQRP